MSTYEEFFYVDITIKMHKIETIFRYFGEGIPPSHLFKYIPLNQSFKRNEGLDTKLTSSPGQTYFLLAPAYKAQC